MSKYDKNSTARLPLIESVIVIAVFMIVSAAILQLYVCADRLQKKSVNISKATIAAENLTEAVIAGTFDIHAFEPDQLEADNAKHETAITAAAFYDADWQQTGQDGLTAWDGSGQMPEGARFCAVVSITGYQVSEAGTLADLSVAVYTADSAAEDDAEPLAAIETSFFRQ